MSALMADYEQNPQMRCGHQVALLMIKMSVRQYAMTKSKTKDASSTQNDDRQRKGRLKTTSVTQCQSFGHDGQAQMRCNPHTEAT